MKSKPILKTLQKIRGIARDENERFILSLLEKDQSARVLDCGCGGGNLTKEVAARVGTDKIYGIDAIPELVRASKEKGIECCLADLNNPLPIEDESFDVVHANQVIEHLCRTDGFLRESYRILRGGEGIWLSQRPI